MANTKIYQIQINGLTESVKAVDALSDSLQFLDKKIKELESKTVNIKTNSSGGGNVKALQTEDALLKQIQKTEQDIVNTRREEYQQLLADKELLKETKNIQEQRAASERLAASNYGNTMQGLKQELADIKSVMQTTDLDSGAFSDMTKRAGELTTKLKELEASYGQFGRNVGNYQSAAEGFKGLQITVAGTTHEFDNAKQAAKTLKQELATLQVKKDQGMLLSDEEAKRFEELPSVVAKIQSSIQDAGKPMDALMDSMQSFVAIAQAGKGVSAFFGFDNDEIERSIQKLVALQNAMKGLETIQKQLQSQEGIGKVFSQGSKNIDSFVAKLTGAKIGMDGLEKSTKLGTVSVNLFSNALKGLASVGILGAISAIFYAIEKGVEWLSDWIKGDADLVKAEDALTASLDQQNKVLDKNLDLIQKRVGAGELNAQQARVEQEKAYAKAIEETKKKLLEREEVYRQADIVKSGKSGINLENIYGDTGVTSFGGFDEMKSIEDFTKRWDLLSTAVANGTDALNKWNYTADDAKDDFVHLIKIVGGDMVNAFSKFADGSAEGTKQLVEYINHMDELTGGRYTQALKIGIDKGFLDGQFKMAFDQYQKLKTDIYKDPLVARLELDSKIKSDLDRLFPKNALQEQINEYNALLKKGVNEAGETLTMAERANISKVIRGLEEQKNKIDAKTTANYKKLGKETQAAENELTRLRIAQMKEGLNKTITQLEEERKAKIAKIKLDGKMVGELTLETNKYYDKQIEDAKKDHAEKVEQIYKDMWAKINADELANLQKQKQNLEDTYESIRKTVNTEGKKDRTTSSYGIQGKNQFSPQTRQSLGIVSEDKSEDIAEMKQYIDMYREYNTLLSENTQLEIESLNITGKLSDKEAEIAELQLEYARKEEDVLKNRNENYKNYLINKYGEEKFIANRDALIKENYSSDLSALFKERMAVIESYWKLRKDTEIKGAEEVYKAEKAVEDKRYANESANTKAHYDDIAKQIGDDIEKGLIPTVEEAAAMFLVNQANYQKADEELRKEHEKNVLKIEEDKKDKINRVNSEYYQDALQELRDFQTATNNLKQKQPVFNSWGILNLKETKKNNENLRKSYEEQLKKIAEKRNQINEDFKKGIIIDKDVYDATIRELDNAANSIGEELDSIGEDLIEQWWGSINQWVQVIGHSASNILGSIGDIVSNGYEKRIEEQEKYIDKYKNMLDKQKDITQQYADDVNGIEDELSNARGDRRQQLIDQLNAQMAAQRASLAEEKRIEKEQEKAEKKKKKLEHDKAVAEKKMSLWQAGINAAMAVSMAAVNHWPMPALAMMAMAASVGAAQIAAVASKPIPSYGSGGVIEGKSHSQGGVKVLGGRAEVEGGEFITNKATTAKNVELLEFVNSRRKRLSLDDMIEFYGGGTVKRNIQSAKTKFADGGQIPTLRNDISLNNGLLSAFSEYSNRPSVVQVVDIVNATERLNNVKVMAGLLD